MKHLNGKLKRERHKRVINPETLLPVNAEKLQEALNHDFKDSHQHHPFVPENTTVDKVEDKVTTIAETKVEAEVKETKVKKDNVVYEAVEDPIPQAMYDLKETSLRMIEFFNEALDKNEKTAAIKKKTLETFDKAASKITEYDFPLSAIKEDVIPEKINHMPIAKKSLGYVNQYIEKTEQLWSEAQKKYHPKK